MHIIALSAEKFSYAPEVQNDLLWTVIGSPWGLPACWLVLINLITFFVFGLDKWKARRKEKKETVRRVSRRKTCCFWRRRGAA